MTVTTPRDYLVIACGETSLNSSAAYAPLRELPTIIAAPVPGRELNAALQPYLAAALGSGDPGETTAAIAQRPDVPALGAPQLSRATPQRQLRLIIIGDPVGISAVVTRLMRLEALWVEVALLPVPGRGLGPWHYLDILPAATTAPDYPDLVSLARSGDVAPVPLVRDDSGQVLLDEARLTPLSGQEGAGFVGEVYIDDTCLATTPIYGVAIRPTATAPGLCAAPFSFALGQSFSVPPRRLSERLRSWLRGPQTGVGEVCWEQAATGRAVQAGGVDIQIHRAGVAHPRPVERVTFYRHLLDLQLVRPTTG